MSELRTRLVIEAEARGAQAALRATERDLAALGERTRDAAREGEGIRRAFDAAAGGLAGVRQQALPAAGAVGNLVAQFNDVGQMVALGQSPLLIAAQQGSQIAQVLGAQGAAGAARTLAGAFAALLSPVNLAVLAITAGVAALGQWGLAALSAGDAGRDFGDALEGLAEAVKSLESASRAVGVPVEEQIARYGRLSDAVRAALAAELELAATQARARVEAAAEALAVPRIDRGRLEADAAVRAEIAALESRRAQLVAERADAAGAGAGRGALARLEEAIADVDLALSGLVAGGALAELSTQIGDLASRLGISGEAARALALALADLDAAAAEGPAATAAAAAVALDALRAAYDTGFEGADQTARELAAALAALARQAADAARLTGEAGSEAARAVGRAAEGAKGRLDELARLRQELIGRQLGLSEDLRARELAAREFEARSPLPADATEGQRRAWEQAREAAAAYAAELVQVRQALRALEGNEWASAQIAAFQQKADLAAIEARHGRDSTEAALARAAAEREALAAQAEARGVAGELLQRLLDSWQAAAGLAGVDLASPIAAARLEAQGLAGALAAALAGAAAGLADLDRRLDAARLRLSTVGRPVDQARAMAALDFERQNPLPDLSALPDGQRNAGLAEWSRLRAETIAKATELARLDAEAAARLRAAFSGGGGGGGGGGSGGGGGGGGGGGVASLAPELVELDRILSGLPLKAAQIGERVKSGLMTSAQGAEAMREATRHAAEGLADLIPRLDALGPAGSAGAERARAALADLAGEIGGPLTEALDRAAQGIEGAFEDAFVSWVTGGRDAAAALVDAVLAELARLAYAQWIQPLLEPLFQAFTGLFAAQGAVLSRGAVLPFAAGGVPELSAYRDSVVDTPTLFGLAGGGTGLMGEAGPEAILPLVGPAAAPTVRALFPDGAAGVLPLARIGGRLGVDLGAVLPFAAGGVPELSAYRDSVVDTPTLFGLAGGGTGLMGEAGPEAILPLVGPAAAPAVRALFPDGAAGVLPLARIGGRLGVDLGAVLPFAAGGVPELSAYRDSVVDAPTLFGLAGGGTGLMGEAGPEAILPLVGPAAAPAVRALFPDGAAGVLPLARIGGRLGVDLGAVLPFAAGGVPGWAAAAVRPAGSAAVAAPAAARGSQGPVIHVHNHASRDVETGVRATDQDGQWTIEVLVERVEERLSQRLGRGVGALNAAMGGIWGLRRSAR